MSRRTPRSVRLLSQRIEVAIEENLTVAADHDDAENVEAVHGHRAFGVFDPNQLIIWLDKASSSERRKVTLVHELLHAMLNVARIDKVETEEEFVGRAAPVLLSFLRENRAAVAYIQES